MKTKKGKTKAFDTVDFFRGIKSKIAKELEGKSFAEQKEFIRKVLSGEIKLNLS